MNIVLIAVACYGPYMAISGTLDVVHAVRSRRAGRVFVVPSTSIRPTAASIRPTTAASIRPTTTASHR